MLHPCDMATRNIWYAMAPKATFKWHKQVTLWQKEVMGMLACSSAALYSFYNKNKNFHYYWCYSKLYNFYFLDRLWNARPTTTSPTPGGTHCSTSWRGTSKPRCHALTVGPSPGLPPALRTPARSTPWYRAHERSDTTLIPPAVLPDKPLKWYSFIRSCLLDGSIMIPNA